MMPALLLSLVGLTPLAAPLAAQATLAVVVRGDRVGLVVTGPNQPFVGCVLGSLSPQLTHYFVGLPPLLTDGVLLGCGVGGAGTPVRVELLAARFPRELPLFVQGVVLENGVFVSGDVGQFVIDG